ALFPSLATQAQALEARPDPTLRNSVLVVGVGYPGEALYDFKARAEDYTPDAEDRQRLPDREPPPYGGAERFLDFLESELKPMIASAGPVARRLPMSGPCATWASSNATSGRCSPRAVRSIRSARRCSAIPMAGCSPSIRYSTGRRPSAATSRRARRSGGIRVI